MTPELLRELILSLYLGAVIGLAVGGIVTLLAWLWDRR